MDLAKIHWMNAIYMISYHLGLAIALPFYIIYTPPSLAMIALTLILVVVISFSVTGGYHRYYSHRAYKANKFFDAVMLFFGTMSNENSVLKWASNHRLHHRYTEQDKDPYNINKGFLHAHILWVLQKGKPYNKEIVKDLYQNKLVVFQDKYYYQIFFGANILTFLLVGWLLKDFVGALLMTWLTRTLIVHHTTFFINSAAHKWGSRHYASEETAVDNYLVSLFTFGEGYHNYHHAFPNDYRNGTRWYHWDPTKWMIWTLSRFKITKELKRINTFTRKKVIILEDRKRLLEKISANMKLRKGILAERITSLSDRIVFKLNRRKELIREYKATKKKKFRYKIKQS